MAESRPRAVNYTKVTESPTHTHPMREMIDNLIANHYPDLADVDIAMLWRHNVKPNTDGHIELCGLTIESDKERALHEHEVSVWMNKQFWDDANTRDEDRILVLDNKLCSLRLNYDRNDDPRVDAEGRPLLRIAKPDLNEFRDVVRRHNNKFVADVADDFATRWGPPVTAGDAGTSTPDVEDDEEPVDEKLEAAGTDQTTFKEPPGAADPEDANDALDSTNEDDGGYGEGYDDEDPDDAEEGDEDE